MKKYKLHFICRGNIYRSRLAAACAANIDNDLIEVTSSGIAIADNPGVDIAPYALYAAENRNIVHNLSRHKVQTTQELLAEADILVFMSNDVYVDAVKKFDINPHKCAVWDVKDIGVRLSAQKKSLSDEAAVHRIALDTYRTIRDNVHALINELTSVGWADIVDDQNQELGFRLPVSWAGDKGLWRRGCHAVIMTATNKYLVEKRSKNIVFSPNHLDITLGGGVETGETPEAAIAREVREELGLVIDPSKFILLEVHKWNTYHPHYKKYSRCFLYTYYTKLDSDRPKLKIQQSEVAEVKSLSSRQVDRLLRFHRLTHFGRLSSGFKYYTKIIKLARSAAGM